MTGRLILLLNRVFRRPGVEGRESAQAYSEWEYRWGRDLVAEYLEPRGDLAGKRVLDIGCGLGGKTVAYGEAGAAEILGIDLSLDNILASRSFAGSRPRQFRWGFAAGDAVSLPLPDEAFDTVIANDAMEHFAAPEAALREMARVTRRGGVIWLFFTPHFSPLGSHLYDYIYTPWCHLLFSRRGLRRGVAAVLRRRAGGEALEVRDEIDPASGDEIDREVERIMTSYNNDLNHMSIRRFRRIVGSFPQLRIGFKEYKPVKYRFLKALTRVPGLRELFTGTVVCRLERME